MVMDRLGVRPRRYKIDAVAQLTGASTVEEVSPDRHDWLPEEVRPPIQRPLSADFECSSGQPLRFKIGKEAQDAMQ